MRPTLLGVVVTALLSVGAGAQIMKQSAKLVGSEGDANATQGASVALSRDGTQALVGGPADAGYTGAVWFFERTMRVWAQTGSKLVPGTADGNPSFGQALAISADGSTAVIGGPGYGVTGAAWVFTRAGGVWAQEGDKLVGSGAAGNARQGSGAAVSADGSTILLGGVNDAADVGAAWVFVRDGSGWVQQGSKLVGSGAVGASQQGWSVAISHDGNTALVGGRNDDGRIGAAWVFTRTGGVWTQQGGKLVGTGAAGKAFQGFAVDLSADGNTALIGGPYDDEYVGASWVFSRVGGAWMQEGSKLVADDRVGKALQGWSVALSSDGGTAVFGAPNDDGNLGAAWLFKREAGVWAQQGGKLVGIDWVGPGQQGRSIALSANGKIALVGASLDDGNAGAAWVFTASGSTNIRRALRGTNVP